MLIASRQFLWPLGLLIIVSGCAGDRIRQTLHPDREFMQLSELEEYDRKHGEIHGEDPRTSGKFASLSREDDADETADKKAGFLNFKRLFGRDNNLPPDPFLDEEDTDVADADERDADAKDKPSSTITIASSREITEPEQTIAEELIRDDWVSKTSTSRPAAKSTVAGASSGTGTSFADTLDEFDEEEDKSSDDDDEFDALARRLANEVASDDFGDEFADDQADSDAFVLNPETLTQEPSDDDSQSIPRLPEGDELLAKIASDDLLGRDFDIMSDANTADDLLPKLPAFSDDEPALSLDGFAGDEAVQAHPLADTADLAATELIGSGTGDSQSMIADVESAVAESTFKDQPALSLPARAPDTLVERDSEFASALTVQQQDVADQQPEVSPAAEGQSRPRITTAAPMNPMLPNQNCEIETGHSAQVASTRRTAPPMIAQASVSAMEAGTTAFSNEPFLTDFHTQAGVMQRPPAVTAAVYSGSGYSTKLWLMLLGGVVILYLLFAPEQKSPQETYNR